MGSTRSLSPLWWKHLALDSRDMCRKIPHSVTPYHCSLVLQLKLSFCSYLIFLCDSRSVFGDCQTDMQAIKMRQNVQKKTIFNIGKAFVFTIYRLTGFLIYPCNLKNLVWYRAAYRRDNLKYKTAVVMFNK